MPTKSWPTHLMDFARLAAEQSKDSTQVGAALVLDGNIVALTAYNGPPKGVKDSPARRERPAKYLYTSHAEANLIAFAARRGIRTEGATVYVTHYPCSSCAKALIQAGVSQVVFGTGATSMPDEEFDAAAVMLSEAHVDCVSVERIGSRK